MNTNTPLRKHITRLLLIALMAMTVPAAVCQASVEPELTMAVRQKNLPKVEQLIAGGANVNERDEGDEQTPLMRAVQVKDAALVQFLLAHGAAIDAQDDTGTTALMFAAKSDAAEIIKLLLRKGANSTVRNASAVTAAQIAEAQGHTMISRLLARAQQTGFRKDGKSTGARVLALK